MARIITSPFSRCGLYLPRLSTFLDFALVPRLQNPKLPHLAIAHLIIFILRGSFPHLCMYLQHLPVIFLHPSNRRKVATGSLKGGFISIGLTDKDKKEVIKGHRYISQIPFLCNIIFYSAILSFMQITNIIEAGSSIFGSSASKPTVGFGSSSATQSGGLFGQKPLFGSSTQQSSLFGWF